MLFVILGSDQALTKRALDRVLDSLGATDIGTDRFDAATTSFDALFAAVTSAPFFGSQRIIVLSGLLAQVTSKGGKGTKTKADGDVARLTRSLPDTTTLILFDPELSDIGSQLRKQLPEGVTISVNDAPRGNSLVELTCQMASDRGSTLDQRTARSILDRLFPGYWPQAPQNRAFDRPPSIELLESEISKVSLAAYPGPITVQVVDDLVPQRTEDRIFSLLDAVIEGNQRAALHETSNALRSGEDASRTMNQIYQQIELAVGAVAAGRPSDPLQSGRALGLSSAYRLGKVTTAVQRSKVTPARQLRLALENDRKLKSGRLRNPDEAMVDLVVRTTQAQENR